MQAWLGYFQSVRPAEAGLTVNVDLASGAFHQQLSALKFLAIKAGVREPGMQARMDEYRFRQASQAITMLKVQGLLHFCQSLKGENKRR